MRFARLRADFAPTPLRASALPPVRAMAHEYG